MQMAPSSNGFPQGIPIMTLLHMHGTCPTHPHRLPPPASQGGTPEISQKSVKIEWFKIFQFCLKILNLWRFLHQLTPTPTPTPPNPTTPKGRSPNLLKHDKTWMNQDISILFKDLKSVNHHTPHPPTSTTTDPPTPKGGPPNQLNVIQLERIKIFQFCLKIWNLWRLPTYGWVYILVGGLVGGWVGWWEGSCQITKNFKNVDLIKIIQFCLKIYDL